MPNIAAEIIKTSVDRIMAAMREGRFSREDLETIKKIFEEGARATQSCLDRGPNEEAR